MCRLRHALSLARPEPEEVIRLSGVDAIAIIEIGLRIFLVASAPRHLVVHARARVALVDVHAGAVRNAVSGRVSEAAVDRELDSLFKRRDLRSGLIGQRGRGGAQVTV